MKNLFSAALLLTGAAALLAADAPRVPEWNGKETMSEYAKRAELEPTLTIDLGDGVKWEGVLAPAGSFVMGSAPGEAKTAEAAAQEKQHTVTISRPFYIGKFELTQAQYEKVVGSNPSTTLGKDLPVCNVAVKDAEDFCEKMSKLTGKNVLLPTEAQWEFACRAGTTTAYCNGDAVEGLDKVCWYGSNSGGTPHPVGQKQANNWGIYDMHGNIREFVRDLYSDKPQEDATDPTGPKEGDAKNHVVRGGAYSANAEKAGNCRSGSRHPTERLEMTGFRMIVEIPK